jgi:hypothetical protein
LRELASVSLRLHAKNLGGQHVEKNFDRQYMRRWRFDFGRRVRTNNAGWPGLRRPGDGKEAAWRSAEKFYEKVRQRRRCERLRCGCD